MLPPRHQRPLPQSPCFNLAPDCSLQISKTQLASLKGPPALSNCFCCCCCWCCVLMLPCVPLSVLFPLVLLSPHLPSSDPASLANTRGRVGHVSWACHEGMLVPGHVCPMCPKCVLSMTWRRDLTQACPVSCVS